MRTKLVKIGRSRGVKLPQRVLRAIGATDEVEIRAEEGRIVLSRPGWNPREGWAEAILAADNEEKDWSDWMNMKNEFDDTEWTWPDDFKWPDKPIVSKYVRPYRTAETPTRGKTRKRHSRTAK